MKKLVVWLGLLVLLPLQACAADTKWEEGTHYTVLNEAASAKPEVTEFFSFWCPHCYRTEPFVEMLKKKLGGKAEFNKVHVNFMPSAPVDVQEDATKAMMIARALKQSDSLNAAIFDYLHKQRASITGMKDLRNIFVINGIDGAEFDKLAKSFGVNSMFKKNQKTIDDYRAYVRGVPNFIVNGKYQVTFTRDMSVDDQLDLILWLTQQK